MSEILRLGFSAAAGAVLGTIFFGSLWWTVRQGLSSPRPALWFFASLLLRLSLALAGFYVVGGRDWERLLSCLLGFVLARSVVTRWTRLPGEHLSCPRPEASHAP